VPAFTELVAAAAVRAAMGRRRRRRSDLGLDLGGVCMPLRSDEGEVLGAAVCSPGTSRPIYVSAGNLVSLPTAVEVVLRCCRYRVPEPIRLADQRSRAAAQRLGEERMHGAEEAEAMHQVSAAAAARRRLECLGC
jgi:hypothetical protein